ncbi:TetR/AcrR family transcriptional regulator [Mycolicibacterium nivoides]|uniref:TetR/AcrR family transcriptional regulator n=2 Tax=Mycolicibacterium nivoides TaxID=2487344 RepID=A0ABW9LFN5_9MYCO|nr:TetR/AcrR family transcriptional regulator [Mycolicibacterium nivoides]
MTIDTTPQAARRPYAPRMAPAQRREHLLDAALRVIAEHGVGKVSMDSVAKQAGVTRPVVYKHFDDTNALLRASLVREEQRAVAQYRDAFPPASSQMALTERLRTLYANLLKMFEASPDLWRAILVLADSTTSAFRTRLEQGRELAANSIEALLTAQADGDSLPPDTDVELLARMMLSLILESGRLLLTDPDNYPRERLLAGADTAVTSLIRP